MSESLGTIRRAIARATGRAPDGTPEPVGGGCIHRAFVLDGFFVKTNQASFLPMFESEAESLRALAATDTIRVPEAITTGSDITTAFLVLERLDLGGPANDRLLGEQLAALHQHTGPSHGWKQPNFIGSTPQPNPPSDDWTTFFRDHRLGHMFRLLEKHGTPVPMSEDLLTRTPELLAGIDARPSLLHGDLWAGNAGYLSCGTPVIFDPATYFGHRETDLAMSTLFGGFGPRFYQAYHANWPLDPGHEERQNLYNLYHILNHALLFGGGYTAQATRVIQDLLQR